MFRDPFARRLAGARGESMLDAVPGGRRDVWAWVTRTYLFDQLIAEQVRQGLDMVVNLAAGLDTRPYRMPLPASLQWVELDFPDLIDYKEQTLQGERASCSLERNRLDLSDVGARRALFDRLGRWAKKALIITEGLLIYLTPADVGSLAEGSRRATGLPPLGLRNCVAGASAPAAARDRRAPERGGRPLEVRSGAGGRPSWPSTAGRPSTCAPC